MVYVQKWYKVRVDETVHRHQEVEVHVRYAIGNEFSEEQIHAFARELAADNGLWTEKITESFCEIL